MRNVRPPEPEEGWQEASLVDYRPRISKAPNPAKPKGKARVDRNEEDLVALAPQSADELPRDGGVPTQDVSAGRDHRYPHGSRLLSSAGAFSTSQFPMARHSSPERSKTSSASSGRLTIGKPWRLNEVFSTAPIPVRRSNSVSSA